MSEPVEFPPSDILADAWAGHGTSDAPVKPKAPAVYKPTHPGRRCLEIAKRMPQDRPITGVELGVYDGRLSAMLLSVLPRLSLHMVDNWAAEESQPSAYRATPDACAHLTQLEQDEIHNWAAMTTAFARERRAIHWTTSAHAASLFQPGEPDFVFVDADHSREGVALDIQLWAPLVKVGGWLCGHDYDDPNFPGVTEAVDEAVALHGWRLETGEDHTWFVRL